MLNLCIYDILLVTSLTDLMLSSYEQQTLNYKTISIGNYDLLYNILLGTWLPHALWGEGGTPCV